MLDGKGFFIWQIPRTEGGNITAIADLALAANFKHILIKIADGVYSSNLLNGADLVTPLVNALHARGIEAWGWHYVYGDDPTGEANKAIQRIQQTGVGGYIIDAEVEYKRAGWDARARTFMGVLRKTLPFFPIALSTYRFPTIHKDFPYLSFLPQCDFAMPQMYWLQAHDPRAQLVRCINEYRALTALPIVPTGAAFSQGTWSPSTAEIVEFLNAAREFNLSGANFWEWYPARQLTDVWNTIVQYNWPVYTIPLNFISRARVNTTAVNIRSGPGIEYQKVGSLRDGTRVAIFELHQGWARISADRGLWVYSVYLDRIP